MQDRPTARELVEAVAEFLNAEVAPTLNDPRLRFRALVAANVLSVVARELEMGEMLVRSEYARLSELEGYVPLTSMMSAADALSKDTRVGAHPPSPSFHGVRAVSTPPTNAAPDGRGENIETGEALRERVAMMTRELAARIRAGEADEGAFHAAVLAHVERTVMEKLEIANPRYLARSIGHSE